MNEDTDYEQQIAYYKKIYASTYNLESLEQNMFVIPVSFAKEHKHMLAHCAHAVLSSLQHLGMSLCSRKRRGKFG